LRFVLRHTGDRAEPAIAAVVVMILLASATAQSLRLEAIFGAFVCGAVIGSCGELERSRVAALRPLVLAFLAPVYFVTAGLRMNIRTLASAGVIGTALLVLVVAIVGKFTGAYLGARASKLNRWEALALGAGMNARGIVEIVVATVGLQTGVLSIEAYTIIILVAVITSVMAPPILRLAMQRVEYTAEEEIRTAERSFTR
jgi:Kef-type K+ transport system membrane component KefB